MRYYNKSDHESIHIDNAKEVCKANATEYVSGARLRYQVSELFGKIIPPEKIQLYYLKNNGVAAENSIPSGSNSVGRI